MSETDETGTDHRQADKPVPPTTDAQQPPSSNEHQEVSKSYGQHAKDIWYVGVRWLGVAVRWLDGHDGLITAIATVAIAALTWVLAEYASDQGEILNRQFRLAKEQSDAYNTTERAFVTVSDVRVSTMHNGPDKSVISHYFWTPIIENSGNTPTRDLDDLSEAMAVPTKPVPGYRNPYAGVALPDSPGDPNNLYRTLRQTFKVPARHFVLGPHATAPIGGIGVPVVKNSFVSISDIEAGTIKVYEFGIVRYRDIFPNSPAHVTKFCYELGMDMNEQGVLAPTHTLCQHWNCADDECKEDRAEYDAQIAAAFRKAGKPVPREFRELPPPAP